MLVCGNISRCQGCSGKILRREGGKPLPPPDDLVVQHKEYVLFQNPRSGVFQLSHDLRNVYYHPRLSCIHGKFSSFRAGLHLRISKETLTKLTNVHKQSTLSPPKLTLWYVIYNHKVVTASDVYAHSGQVV